MKKEFSAGGIIIKKNNGEILILVSQHSGHHGWVFPKGLIGDHFQNETKEETALREVEEETGARAKILIPLSPIEFVYEWEGKKIHKTVYYYLMEYISGDISKHDWEMEDVKWLPMERVENTLTYNTDKKVWLEAKNIITKT